MTTPQLLEGQSGLPVDSPTHSYWHKEPSEKLLGHRTTTELPPTADVVIVGSGITGAFAAHALKEQKPELDVAMLEAREACWGASGRVGNVDWYLEICTCGPRITNSAHTFLERRPLPTAAVHIRASHCLLRAAHIPVHQVADRHL